jgi:sugar-specific transcriptional regulator TrmB
MDQNIIEILKEYGLSSNESKIYLTALSLGTSPASSIARVAGINRVTTYWILKDLQKQWIITETIKNNVQHYGVLSPEILLKKLEDQFERFKTKLPEMLALTHKLNNKPRVEFYEWLQGLKEIVNKTLISSKDTPKGEFVLSFIGTTEIDPNFQNRLSKDFAPQRKKYSFKTRIISSKGDDTYTKFNQKQHESIVIDDQIFDMGNEIIIHGGNKVSVLMYTTHEMCGLLIESKTLHDALKSMFNLIWKIYKK